MSDRIFNANDTIEFSRMYEAINAVVGTEYHVWQKATWPSRKGNGHFRIWFVYLAKFKNGQYIAARNDCLNILTSDWNEFIYDDLKKRDVAGDTYYTGYDLIFAKEHDGNFIFRGVYVRDEEKSSLNHHVSKRVATKIRMIGTPAYDIELLDNVGSVPFSINEPIAPKEIIHSASGLSYVCGRCGAIFIEAKRCSECGQMVLKEANDNLLSPNAIRLNFNSNDSAENIVSELIRYMEARGLVFSSKSIKGSSSYGILKGKTSIGYRHEGIVLFCAKDEIDKNAIASELKLPVFNNSEGTRPYKIVLDENGFIQAVEVLLRNDNNH